MKNKIAVLWGTPIDTRFGKQFLTSLWYKDIITRSSASSPSEQNKLQFLKSNTLQGICEAYCKEFRMHWCKFILIYCNSLTSILDLEKLKVISDIPVFSPRDVYQNFSKTYSKIMIIAANATGSKLAEESLLLYWCDNISTFWNLDIVYGIEDWWNPEKIYSNLWLLEIIKFSEKNNFEAIVLSCTHFPYLRKILQEKTYIPIIDLDMWFKLILGK